MTDPYLHQPREVSIETLALCNARCTFCPYPGLERIGTKMPDALLDRLIDEMSRFQVPFYFSPFKVNEPLLDKRLIPLCEKFNRDVRMGGLRIFTNGSGLTDTNIIDLAGLQRVGHLWISLNSHDADEYERIMGLSFEQTTRRLDRLHRIGFPHEVVLSAVGNPNDDFRAYCHGRWPKFQCVTLNQDAWIDYTDPQIATVPDTECVRWWELSITATGIASRCCMDSTGEYGFGDVNTSSLLEIYNHPTLLEWRRAQMSRKSAGSPCDRCSYGA